MDERTKFLTYFSIFLLWLFNISAILGILSGQQDWFMSKTPLNMLLILSLVVFVYPLNSIVKVSVFMGIVVTSIFAEWLGINYGLIFGDYSYGNNFGAKIAGVPYLIGINWAVLTFATAAISASWFRNYWLKTFCGTFLMLVLDFFMETSAPVFDFWYWDIGHPPLQNFIGWFALAFVFHAIAQKLRINGNENFSLHLYASQITFFMIFYFYNS